MQFKSLTSHRWGFHTISHAWTQYDIFSNVPERPSQGASTEAPDLGLAFYMNGMITNWSAVTTSYLGNNTEFLEGMVVIDLNNQTVYSCSKFTLWVQLTFSSGNK